MDDLDERDRLQQDIEQIHQVLSADEGSSDEDDELEALDESYIPRKSCGRDRVSHKGVRVWD